MKGTMFRTFTEDVNRSGIESIMNKYFDAFTVYEATGCWKGTQEKSLVLEVLSSPTDIKVIEGNVKEAAKEIKELNRQEAVLVQKIDNNNWLI